jgi:type IV pilus assembly protein PilV
MTPRSTPARGLTLLEVMISMSLLLVGLLGMMGLQVWGLNSNQGARANTTAAQLARELASALERLPFDDARLNATTHFGPVLHSNGTVVTSGYTNFTPVAGARGDEEIERLADGRLVYERRWTVRVRQIAGRDSAKLVAVSVVYKERGLPRWKEVVVYGHNVNRPLLSQFLPGS